MNGAMTVYHGTTAAHAASILAHGLTGGACVTTDEALAWYYAEAASEEQGYDDAVVLALTVRTQELRPDRQALAEPVGWAGRTSDQISDEVGRLDAAQLDLQASLILCASARVGSRVEAERIRRT